MCAATSKPIRRINKAAIVYLTIGVFLVLGLLPDPQSIVKLGFEMMERPTNFFAYILFFLFPTLTFFPIGLFALSFRKRNNWPATYRGPNFLFSLIIQIFGFPLLFFYSALAGPGMEFILLHGTGVLLGASGALKLYRKLPELEKISLRQAGIKEMIVALIIALWSLCGVIGVIASATKIAVGLPYCIAAHGQSQPITSLWQLRGVSFYTASTGYKDSSRWFFHGVMVVNEGGLERYYNWSPANMRFDRVKRESLMIRRIYGACQPRKNFIGALFGSG